MLRNSDDDGLKPRLQTDQRSELRRVKQNDRQCNIRANLGRTGVAIAAVVSHDAFVMNPLPANRTIHQLTLIAAIAAFSFTPAFTSEPLTLHSSGLEVLRYQAAPLANPVGNEKFPADKFQASHFIHPLKTPSGFVITEIQPEDHLHHFGVWWPWKMIQNGDRALITWELQREEGFVRSTGAKKAGNRIIAEAEHVDLLADDGPEVLLHETATITVSDTIDHPAKGYYVDISIEQTPAVDRNVIVTQYRYSGFTVRGTLFWDAENSSLLTSHDMDSENGNGTRARWVRFQGAKPAGGSAGFVMMSHPGNHNHPEQIRIWDNGQPFINFNPVMSESWVLRPGNRYTRNYRLFVYDGEVSAGEADNLWEVYRSSVAATVDRKFFVFDNGLTDVASPEAQAALLAHLGYDGICIRPANTDDELLAAFDEHEIEISATYVVLDADVGKPPNALVEHMESLRGRDTIVWLALTNSGASEAAAVETIRRVCDLAAANGLEVVLYPHLNFHTDTVENSERLRRIANRSNLGISFTLCHFLAQTDEKKLEDTIRAIGPNLKLVQISGANQIPPGKPDWSQLILPLGEGNFDVGRVFRVLDEIGYTGPVNLQCYKIPQPAAKHLETSMNAWKSYHDQP